MWPLKHKALFKEKGTITQQFMIGKYGPQPFYKKCLKPWHHGRRNYYFCARKQCRVYVKSDIKGDNIDIFSVQNELWRSELESFEKNGLYIVA